MAHIYHIHIFKHCHFMALALSLFVMGLSDTKHLFYQSDSPAYLKDDSPITLFKGRMCFLSILKHVLFMV